jgi:hypothetical protein
LFTALAARTAINAISSILMSSVDIIGRVVVIGVVLPAGRRVVTINREIIGV